MKGKDLVIIGAAVFVLYKLAQVKPQVGSGQYLTNMPVINMPSAVVPVVTQTPSGVALLDVRGTGGGGGDNPRAYGGGGGDPYADERQRFLDWVDSIPIGCAGSRDPRCKPSVINVNNL